MKDDERKLLEIMQRECYPTGELSAAEIIGRESSWLNEKRAYYILDKWTDKDWYEYGVSPRVGWMTGEGLIAK